HMNISTCRVFWVDRPLRRAMPNFCGAAAILNIEQGTARSTLAQPLSDGTILASEFLGGVAERLNAPVLKTGRPKGLVSSNLTPSASEPDWPFRLAGRDSAGLKSRDCGI